MKILNLFLFKIKKHIQPEVICVPKNINKLDFSQFN